MHEINGPVAQLSDTGLYQELIEVGAVVGAFGALGGVVGFVAAALAKTLRPRKSIAYGEWVAYSAGLAGTGALCFEIFERAGL